VSWWMEMAPAVIVILLLVGALAVLRRKGLARLKLPGFSGRTRREARIQVLERTTLSAQHTLYLVRVGQLKMLVGGASASCSLLAILPEGESSSRVSLRVPGEPS
jgi:flagellar biogenesis protein FliO